MMNKLCEWLAKLPTAVTGLKIFLVMSLLYLAPTVVMAQDPVDDYDDYYGDEYDDSGYFEDDSYYDDEGYEDDAYSDEDAEYYDESDEYYEDEYTDDEYYDEGDEYLDEGGYDEFGEEEQFGEEEYADDLELADDSVGEIELQELEQREIKQPRILKGYNAKISVVSPWYAGLGLDAWWYSYVDVRVSLDLPRGSNPAMPLIYTLEVSSYSFENRHPSGGQFSGFALLGMVKAPVGPLLVSAGGGIYGIEQVTAGMVFGASYEIPLFKYIFLSADTRLNYTMKGTPSGAVYWIDVGGTVGYLF
ncbi:hypothetical protein ACFL6E_05010 [Candidatus Neomarinimicrobiota bacterium]